MVVVGLTPCMCIRIGPYSFFKSLALTGCSTAMFQLVRVALLCALPCLSCGAQLKVCQVFVSAGFLQVV